MLQNYNGGMRRLGRHAGPGVAFNPRRNDINAGEAQNRPLAEIALALNFSSQANFTRAFRREFGITPGQYREQISR